jgi:arsenate reductase
MNARTLTKQTVLFLCTGNSARSQMAEAILRHLAGDRFDAHSAGIEPKEIHPLTHEVLAEIGIDSSQLQSKDFRMYLGRCLIHHAIVVCSGASQRCPSIYPFARWTHEWPFEDPAAFAGRLLEQRAKFRAVRDAIQRRIREWLQDSEHPLFRSRRSMVR